MPRSSLPRPNRWPRRQASSRRLQNRYRSPLRSNRQRGSLQRGREKRVLRRGHGNQRPRRPLPGRESQPNRPNSWCRQGNRSQGPEHRRGPQREDRPSRIRRYSLVRQDAWCHQRSGCGSRSRGRRPHLPRWCARSSFRRHRQHLPPRANGRLRLQPIRRRRRLRKPSSTPRGRRVRRPLGRARRRHRLGPLRLVRRLLPGRCRAARARCRPSRSAHPSHRGLPSPGQRRPDRESGPGQREDRLGESRVHRDAKCPECRRCPLRPRRHPYHGPLRWLKE
jgi:hypothetical protein